MVVMIEQCTYEPCCPCPAVLENHHHVAVLWRRVKYKCVCVPAFVPEVNMFQIQELADIRRTAGQSVESQIDI